MTLQFQKDIEHLMPLLQDELRKQHCRRIDLKDLNDVEAIRHMIRFSDIYAVIKKLAGIYGLSPQVWQVLLVNALVVHEAKIASESERSGLAKPIFAKGLLTS